ncbi:MAG: hypothetical protein CO109_07215, partial [Deltaproteobacteria bacterium CG_4_9_14_3_um_filter_65_9]
SSLDIDTSANAADALFLNASAGGIDITAAGDNAGEDIDITNTGGEVRITATGSTVLDAIALSAGAGGITMSSGLDAAISMDIDNAGGVAWDIAGAAGQDFSLVNTGGSINLTSTETGVTNAIVLNASGVASGIDIDSGTNGLTIDTTGAISLDAAGAASNFTLAATTDAMDLTIATTGSEGDIIISSADDVTISGNGTTNLFNLDDIAATNAIDVGGNDADGADTVRISTEGTTADSITIGNANAATTVAITGGDDWSIDAAGNYF